MLKKKGRLSSKFGDFRQFSCLGDDYLNNNLVRTVLTDSNCKSGTDRLVNALVNEGYDAYNREFPWDGIINVQGDEPFVSMESVEKCLNYFYFPSFLLSHYKNV